MVPSIVLRGTYCRHFVSQKYRSAVIIADWWLTRFALDLRSWSSNILRRLSYSIISCAATCCECVFCVPQLDDWSCHELDFNNEVDCRVVHLSCFSSGSLLEIRSSVPSDNVIVHTLEVIASVFYVGISYSCSNHSLFPTLPPKIVTYQWYFALIAVWLLEHNWVIH